MGPMLRTSFAVLSTIGLCIGIFIYGDSFFGLMAGPVSNAQPWSLWVFVGALIVAVPTAIVEYDGTLLNYRNYWKRYAELRPTWATVAVQCAWGLALLHMAAFFVITHGGSPDIVNGSYVLSDHGKIIRDLTEAEYLKLAGWETRFMASFLIAIYLHQAVYWWYPSAKLKARNDYDA